MKNIKENAIVKFVVALFLVGFITGFIFYLLYKPDMLANIDAFKTSVSTSHQNTYLYDTIKISSIFVLSISIIGLPILAIITFFEGMSIGFTFAVFISLFSFKGFLFYFLFVLICKLVFLIIFLYFTVISLSYVLKFLDSSINKNKEQITHSIVKEMYRFLIVFITVILNSTFIFLFGNKLVSLFMNIL